MTNDAKHSAHHHSPAFPNGNTAGPMDTDHHGLADRLEQLAQVMDSDLPVVRTNLREAAALLRDDYKALTGLRGLDRVNEEIIDRLRAQNADNARLARSGGPGAVDSALAKAHAVVNDLCQGKRRWTMSVPAQPDSDPDLVISGALQLAMQELDRLRADNAVQSRLADHWRAEAARIAADNAALRADIERHVAQASALADEVAGLEAKLRGGVVTQAMKRAGALRLVTLRASPSATADFIAEEVFEAMLAAAKEGK